MHAFGSSQMRPLFVAFMLAVSLVSGLGAVPGSQEVQDTADPRAGAQDSDYQLGPGDSISIQVSGIKEFSQQVRVSNSGRIHVPFVGVMLVAGMTAVQVEHDVARLIREHELINEPQVRVQVEAYRARPTYVIGEVSAPGQFVITREMYLLDLVSSAGGLLPSADATGFLYRRRAPQPRVQTKILSARDPIAADPGESVSAVTPTEASDRPEGESLGEEVIRIDFKELSEGARPEVNVRLQGGDVLYVPRRQTRNIYVIGDVKTPGAYTLPRQGEITAAQAIIYAGGPMPTAKTGKAFLMRHDAQGVRQAMPVDFPKIIAGKTPDIPVLPDDIIFVPVSATKTVTTGILNMLPELINQLVIF